MTEARDYCDAVNEAIWQGTFRSDQQPLGSKAEPQEVPGRLVVLTCEDWDGARYLSNVVVVADPVERREVPVPGTS